MCYHVHKIRCFSSIRKIELYKVGELSPVSIWTGINRSPYQFIHSIGSNLVQACLIELLTSYLPCGAD